MRRYLASNPVFVGFVDSIVQFSSNHIIISSSSINISWMLSLETNVINECHVRSTWYNITLHNFVCLVNSRKMSAALTIDRSITRRLIGRFLSAAILYSLLLLILTFLLLTTPLSGSWPRPRWRWPLQLRGLCISYIGTNLLSLFTTDKIHGVSVASNQLIVNNNVLSRAR